MKTQLSSQNTTSVHSRFSPWLTPVAYALGCWIVLPAYFRIHVSGQENLPTDGPVILAPTHRARWDSLLIPYIAGRYVTGRDIHFMVTSDEVKGLQGWMIQRLGGFPVNPRQPTIASLRHGVEVLQNRQMLVIYPEGGIFRDKELHDLKPGLARLALQAEASKPNLGIKIVPIHIDYEQPLPKFGCGVTLNIGRAIDISGYMQGPIKQNAQRLTTDIANTLQELIQGHQAEMSDFRLQNFSDQQQATQEFSTSDS